MGGMVKGLMGGGGKARRQEIAATAKAKDDQAMAFSRARQEQASSSAATEASLKTARRTPRGRRLLMGDQGSTLG